MLRTVIALALAGVSAAGCGSTPGAERSTSPESCPDRAAYATDEADNSGASWSPDGRSIAFSSTRSGRSEIYVLDVATCAVRRVTQNGGTEPDWAPDGERLVFGRDLGSLWIVNADGGGERLLTKRGMFPAWSPRGDLVAFDAGGYGDGPREIWTIRPDGSGLRRVAAGTWNLTAAWHPDGETIAWTRGGAGDDRIWRMRLDGTDSIPVTPGEVNGDVDPSWSPDGTQLAYTGSTADVGATVFVVSASGGEPTKLLPDRNSGGPDWSPDGDLITLSLYGRNGTDLYAVAPDGSGLRPLSVVP